MCKAMRKVSFPANSSDLTSSYPCIPLLSELTSEERKMIWFSKEEFDSLRRKLIPMLRQVRKYGPGKLLENVYDDTETSLEVLKRWSRSADSVRGTERHCNQRHRTQRKKLQRMYIQTVLNAQRAAEHVDAEKIAQVACESSKAAREFSIRMGSADAIAAGIQR